MILIADLIYGRDSLDNYLCRKGISSVLIIPSHLTRVHPLVPASLLKAGREDYIEEQVKCMEQDAGYGMDHDGERHAGAGPTYCSEDVDPRFGVTDCGKEGPAALHAIRKDTASSASVLQALRFRSLRETSNLMY